MWKTAAGGVGLLGLGIVGFSFPEYWPLALIIGAALILVFLLTQTKPSTTLSRPRGRMKNDTDVYVPEVWNEQEISLGLDRYRGNSNMLGRYIDGVVSRFVMAQDMRTMQVRTEFLQKFNKQSEVARESYRWHRYIKGGRAALEEDLEDLKAQLNLQKVRSEMAGLARDPELLALEKKAARVELLLRIAQTEKAMADLNKPAPAPPPPGPSAQQERAVKKAQLAARETEVRDMIRITKIDPNLDEEQKQRKLNNLDEKLAQIHEEQTALL